MLVGTRLTGRIQTIQRETVEEVKQHHNIRIRIGETGPHQLPLTYRPQVDEERLG